jgi:hypothetical protein
MPSLVAGAPSEIGTYRLMPMLRTPLKTSNQREDKQRERHRGHADEHDENTPVASILDVPLRVEERYREPEPRQPQDE